MKKLITLLIGILFAIALHGQSKNDYKYVINANGGITIPAGQKGVGVASYIIEKVGATVYANPGTGYTYTSYSGPILSGVLNSAMSQLTTGGEIYIKEGQYDNCDSIRVPYNHIKWEGAGIYKTVIKLKDNYDAAKGNFSGNGFIYANEIEGFEMTDLEMDGNGANQTYIDADPGTTARISAIKVRKNKNAVFENLYIHDFTTFGIQVRVSDSLATIKNCHLDNNYWNNIDISWNSYGTVVEDCLLERCGDIGIAMRAVDNCIVRDTRIRNCTGTNGSSDDAWMGINLENVEGEGLLYTYSKNCVIDNVIIEGAGMKRGINMSSTGTSSGKRNVIQNCTIDSCLYGLYIYGDSNILKGNTLKDIKTVGIIINTGDYNYITGNYVLMDGADISLSITGNADYNKVNGNYFSIGGTDNWFQTIYLHGDADNNIFTNNIIFDGASETSSFNDLGTGNIKGSNFRANANKWESQTGNISLTVAASDVGTSIRAGRHFATISSANANYICFLPTASATTIGTKIDGRVGANGFELRVAAAQAATVYLNGVTTNVEAAIPANSSFEVICIDATHWILKAWTNLGAEITAIVPDAI